MKRISLFLTFILSLPFAVFSQEKQKINPADYTNSSVEMADAFRQDGKIYVVIAVILVLLAGIFIYLFLIDRKITRLEKQYGKSGE